MKRRNKISLWKRHDKTVKIVWLTEPDVAGVIRRLQAPHEPVVRFGGGEDFIKRESVAFAKARLKWWPF